jgi:CRISPR-associated protein Cas1
MRDLHELPRFGDRWAHLYLERGRIEKEAKSLCVYDVDGASPVPVDQLSFVMLGPGTSISHQAMRMLADNNCLVCWVGEQGVRLYAHSTGGTHSAFRLLAQARAFCDPDERLKVVKRMYLMRFPEALDDSVTIEQLRGKEGYRVREAYKRVSEETGVVWQGRSYRQDDWDWSDPVNRALSAANACLYGICHAAILSAGYSPAIGFIHTGKMLSFVYDIADLYKTELAIPVAFRTVAESQLEVDGRVRRAMRDVFHESKLMRRILPDMAEVLGAGDDLEKSPDELEGRIVTLADRAIDWSLSGEPKRPDQGQALGEGGVEMP